MFGGQIGGTEAALIVQERSTASLSDGSIVGRMSVAIRVSVNGKPAQSSLGWLVASCVPCFAGLLGAERV